MTAEVAQSAEEQLPAPKRKNFDVVSVLVEKVTGTVKWFSVRRHYGFIQRDDNKEDVFVHRTAIIACRSRYPTLKNGESVEFSVVETVSGVNAASVTGPNGRVVQGVRPFRRPKFNVDSVGGQQRLNGITPAGGDVEGTRQRGGSRRMGRGRRIIRPSQNGMGDNENTGADRGEEQAGGMEGSRVPYRYPRRFRGGGRGRGRQRSTSTRQVNGEEPSAPNDEEVGAPRQQQGPRRGGSGRFRRGGRLRRGGGAPPPRDGEGHVEGSVTAERGENLEKKVGDMTLEARNEVSEKLNEAVGAVESKAKKELADGDVSAKAMETPGASK